MSNTLASGDLEEYLGGVSITGGSGVVWHGSEFFASLRLYGDCSALHLRCIAGHGSAGIAVGRFFSWCSSCLS